MSHEDPKTYTGKLGVQISMWTHECNLGNYSFDDTDEDEIDYDENACAYCNDQHNCEYVGMAGD